jgi:platelet-activating factor acetylhydrolase
MVDVFLPISFEHPTTTDRVEDVCPRGQDHVSVRFYYPTLEKSGWIPYLRHELSDVFCEETMIAGAPDPLKGFGWMLHTWKLTQIKAKQHAEPLQQDGTGLPVIVYSHGLGGNVDLYAYQTMALAAHGYLVVVIDHTDGSASVAPRKDGIALRRNDSHVAVHEMEGRIELFRRHRRVMTEYRSEEFLAAVRATIALNENNIEELEQHRVSFVGKLNVNEVHYMGHSFGGATSLHAARKRPPTSIVAHEPAVEWIPDGTRASLFDQKRLAGSQGNFTYWQVNANDDLSTSIHDIEMLILYSSEWELKKWGGVDVLSDMYARGQFGPPHGSSRVAVIDGAHHNEFSDTCLLTPVWLARATGITGKRNPIETAEEIHAYTISFLKR